MVVEQHKADRDEKSSGEKPLEPATASMVQMAA